MLHSQLLIMLSISCTFWCTNAFHSKVPKYTINLDLPPEQRFSEICKGFGHYLSGLRQIISSRIPAKYLSLCEKIAVSIDDFFPSPFANEMRGISKDCNITLGDIVLFNLFYEATAYCTSIVASDIKGRILHGRNFDYDFGNFLHNVTYVADFKSKESILYSGVMFAGHLGIATGQKPYSFSISIDERDQGFWWENAFEALFNRKSKVVGLLSRQVLGTDGITFDQAVRLIANSSLIAPAYFILGGVNSTDGAVITHNREKTDDIWLLDSDKRWYLVETNYDHWTTPPPGDDRRHPAEKAMNTTGQANISPETLSKVLSINPVLNNGTVYTTIMSAVTPELFHTYFP